MSTSPSSSTSSPAVSGGVEQFVPAPVQYHDLGPGRRIAYRHHVGTKEPTLLYVPGFFSDMELSKVETRHREEIPCPVFPVILYIVLVPGSLCLYVCLSLYNVPCKLLYSSQPFFALETYSYLNI